MTENLPNIINSLLLLLIFIAVCAGIIILQVWLSNRESMLPGLIMPAASFAFSLLIIFSMVAFTTTSPTARDGLAAERVPLYELDMHYWQDNIDTEMEAVLAAINAEISEQRYSATLVSHERNTNRITSTANIIIVFLMTNIPTAILLAIYASCRGKQRKQRALTLMSVQDL